MKDFFEQVKKYPAMAGHEVGFHNTTNESGAQLELFTAKAETQNEAVYEMFKRYYSLSASECFTKLQNQTRLTWILTSVRRSITNLTNAGKLIKTEKKVSGFYGRPEYVYTLCSDSPV